MMLERRALREGGKSLICQQDFDAKEMNEWREGRDIQDTSRKYDADAELALKRHL